MAVFFKLTKSFQITILGNGAASPTLERAPSAQVVELSGRYFLVDCGEGVQLQLRKNRFSIQKIDHICITHLHGDHYLGLLGLLQSMHLLGRRSSINLYCQAPLKEIIDLQNKIAQSYLNFEINYVFLEKEGMHKLFEDQLVEVYSFPLKHRIACNGFLFKEKLLPRNIDKAVLVSKQIDVSEIYKLKKGLDVVDTAGNVIPYESITITPRQPKSYAICTDTIFDPSILGFIQGADAIYHEATFLEDLKERATKTFHSTAKQAAEIALLAKTKLLILGHFSARYGDLGAFLEEAKTIFPHTVLAKEHEVYEI
jgi:ribonuclease Z